MRVIVSVNSNVSTITRIRIPKSDNNKNNIYIYIYNYRIQRVKDGGFRVQGSGYTGSYLRRTDYTDLLRNQ